jgi:BirA family biotin operon repressor/biotin-[acetyl-CoA-carboxylase] ligase
MIYKNIIGKRIIHLKSVQSTNTYSLDMLADEHLFEGDTICADFQEAGKGLDKNTWESESGKNLLASFVVCPNYIKPESQFILNKIVSLAVSDFVKEILPKKDVKIKWPNDIYVGDEKIAGILINNSINGTEICLSVIGIGLNINQIKFLSNTPNPVSLKKLSGKSFDVNTCLIRLSDYLNLRFRQIMQDKINVLDKEYLSNLYRYKEFADYKIDNRLINAKIVGLNQYGKLCLKSKDITTYCCDLKEVEFVISK